MSFILDVKSDDAPEFHTLENGSEVELRIASAEMRNSKGGDPMLAIRFDIPADPLAKDINHFIMLPNSKDNEKQSAQKLNRVKEFKAAFGLPAVGPIAQEDMEGARGWGILAEEESTEYGKQNKVKKFVIGQ